MNNIRLSINLSKVAGTRVINMKNESGKVQYVAIPVSSLFVPSEKPEPMLMATMIHCPNSIYNDFMLKPYMNSADYKILSQEERNSLPVIGSGTFMQQQQSRALAATAENVEVEAATLVPTSTNAPAATQALNSSSGEARNPQPASPADEFFVAENGQWYGPIASFNEAVAFAELNLIARNSIECWSNGQKRARWNYDPTNFSWKQAL